MQENKHMWNFFKKKQFNKLNEGYSLAEQINTIITKNFYSSLQKSTFFVKEIKKE